MRLRTDEFPVDPVVFSASREIRFLTEAEKEDRNQRT